MFQFVPADAWICTDTHGSAGQDDMTCYENVPAERNNPYFSKFDSHMLRWLIMIGGEYAEDIPAGWTTCLIIDLTLTCCDGPS